MGMYNEVFRTHVGCGGRMVLQISQIVLGFGDFNLDDPSSLKDRLTPDQVRTLYERVDNEWFVCEKCSANEKFISPRAYQIEAMNRVLFSKCPCCGYPECGHAHV